MKLLLSNALCIAQAAHRTGGEIGQARFTTGGAVWATLVGNGLTRVDIGASTGVFIAAPDYATPSLGAHATLVEMAEKRVTGVLDGTVRKIMTGAFTAVAVSATADVLYDLAGGTNVRLAELWFLNDASLLSAVNLSQDIGDRT